MKGDSKLHQSLKMAAGNSVARDGAPEIFEDLVGVEKVALVEEAEARAKVGIFSRTRGHGVSETGTPRQ